MASCSISSLLTLFPIKLRRVRRQKGGPLDSRVVRQKQQAMLKKHYIKSHQCTLLICSIIQHYFKHANYVCEGLEGVANSKCATVFSVNIHVNIQCTMHIPTVLCINTECTMVKLHSVTDIFAAFFSTSSARLFSLHLTFAVHPTRCACFIINISICVSGRCLL